MVIENTQAKRFEIINFLPFAIWLGFVIFNEGDMWSAPAVRIAYGVVFFAAFYGISIYIIFRKRLHKGLIALILLPPTAIFMYVVLLFLKPREPQRTPSSARQERPESGGDSVTIPGGEWGEE